jgi:hypothetical protein
VAKGVCSRTRRAPSAGNRDLRFVSHDSIPNRKHWSIAPRRSERHGSLAVDRQAEAIRSAPLRHRRHQPRRHNRRGPLDPLRSPAVPSPPRTGLRRFPTDRRPFPIDRRRFRVSHRRFPTDRRPFPTDRRRCPIGRPLPGPFGRPLDRVVLHPSRLSRPIPSLQRSSHHRRHLPRCSRSGARPRTSRRPFRSTRQRSLPPTQHRRVQHQGRSQRTQRRRFPTCPHPRSRGDPKRAHWSTRLKKRLLQPARLRHRRTSLLVRRRPTPPVPYRRRPIAMTSWRDCDNELHDLRKRRRPQSCGRVDGVLVCRPSTAMCPRGDREWESSVGSSSSRV